MRLPVCSFLALILVAGCADQPGARNDQLLPTSPVVATTSARNGDARNGFYPLEVGNEWNYDRTLEIEFILDGDGQPPDKDVLRATAEREVVGEETTDGHTYQVMEYRIIDEGQPDSPFISREFYRQTRDALFLKFAPPDAFAAQLAEYKPRGRTTPGRDAALKRLLAKRAAFHRSLAAGLSLAQVGRLDDPVPVEFPTLLYPLHPGLEWTARPYGTDDIIIDREVEGVDVLDLPIGRVAAYRIRHTLPGLFGPNDVAYFWYSRDGFLGYTFDFESEWTDAGGQRLGTFTGTESETLTSLDLVRAGHRTS